MRSAPHANYSPTGETYPNTRRAAPTMRNRAKHTTPSPFAAISTCQGIDPCSAHVVHRASECARLWLGAFRRRASARQCYNAQNARRAHTKREPAAGVAMLFEPQRKEYIDNEGPIRLPGRQRPAQTARYAPTPAGSHGRFCSGRRSHWRRAAVQRAGFHTGQRGAFPGER